MNNLHTICCYILSPQPWDCLGPSRILASPVSDTWAMIPQHPMGMWNLICRGFFILPHYSGRRGAAMLAAFSWSGGMIISPLTVFNLRCPEQPLWSYYYLIPTSSVVAKFWNGPIIWLLVLSSQIKVGLCNPEKHNKINGMSLPWFGNKRHSGFHFGFLSHVHGWAIRSTKRKNKLPIMQVWESLDPKGSIVKAHFFWKATQGACWLGTP